MSQEDIDRWMAKLEALAPHLEPEEGSTIADVLTMNGHAVIACGPIEGAIVTGTNMVAQEHQHQSMTVAVFRAITHPIDDEGERGEPVISTFVVEGDALFSLMRDLMGFGFQAMRALEHMRDDDQAKDAELALKDIQLLKPEDVMLHFESYGGDKPE